MEKESSSTPLALVWDILFQEREKGATQTQVQTMQGSDPSTNSPVTNNQPIISEEIILSVT